MIRIRLKEVLQEKGLSMSMLSHKSQVSFSTISRIINDKKYSPTLNTLERIAKALNVDISDLYEQLPDD
jgi:transcriptional regulator with XRE-family HTH domain